MNFDRAAAKQAGYTDEEIDAYLRQEQSANKSYGNFDRAAAKQAGYTDEEINAYLSQSTSKADLAAQALAPAVTAVGMTPSGFNAQAVKSAVQPIAAIAPQTMRQYFSGPAGYAKLAADVAIGSSVGVPPIASMEAAKAAAKLPGAVMESASRVAQAAGTTSPTAIAGKMARPLAVGAARVLGPLGLAYDVNKAFEFAREQDLGGQLAAGAGRRAPESYRNLMNQNISGYQPTPQEAANLLASGDARTINIYGGPDRLRQLMRQQAAQRVVGPVAPGR